ncbi:DUF5667 domain-containing protein [Nocardioides taihuensis]|uniref:DUF5667 domain-containing protein n=1 Tax=Nocardioides taihuensis TaxID=1835606 RepID=A0ABW0BHE0_9ACTN
MTPAFPARRAEEFNTLVEGSPTEAGGTRYPEFLEIVAALRDVPAVEPRPEFTASLRDRLMAAAETELVPADRTTDEARLRMPGTRPGRQRRLVVAVGSIALVGATTSMAVAAQSALPGDALYPLKRAIENAHAGLSLDEADKGATMLASASGRLREAAELSRAGHLDDSAAVAETLNDFSAQSTEASDLLFADYAANGDQATLDQLHAFTADSLTQLTELEPVVPIDARDELMHAAQVLSQIDAQLQRVCPGCVPSISEIPNQVAFGTDLSGFDPPISLDGNGLDTQGGVKDGTQQAGGGSGGGAGSQDPELLDPLDPVLSPDGDGQTSGGDGGGNTLTDTVDDLTEALLGDGDTSSGNDADGDTDGGLLGQLEGTVDDTTGGLLNP